MTLLGWCETRLGLIHGSISAARRVEAYLQCLETAGGAAYQASLESDRWSTAQQLLMLRDDLLLQGWDGKADERLPGLVNDLARVEPEVADIPPGLADRIDTIFDSLDSGQVLPPHLCVLDEPVSSWPLKWQSLLQRLDEVQVAANAEPSAEKQTALGELQRSLTARHDPVLSRDQSLAYMRSESRVGAAQALISMLASDLLALEATVICCEDEAMARMVDGALAAANLPTAGVVAYTRFHPASQVLPLSLALCREPVDPAVALDFLTLPVNPYPKRVAARLAGALMDQPGIGSEAWQRAVDEVTANANDGVAEKIEQWFHGERIPAGQPMPARLVAERAGQVAQWAIGQASKLDEQHPSDESAPDLTAALRSTATEAGLLSELAGALGTDLTSPQLQRIVDAVAGPGLPATAQPAGASGPTWVRSLAEIRQEYRHLVWLGLGSAHRIQPKWPRSALEMFEQAGVAIDDGAAELGARRQAEQRGLNRITERALLLELPTDDESPPHPLAITVRHGLASGEGDHPRPLSVDRHLAAGQPDELAPWRADVEDRQVLSPLRPRSLWQVDARFLPERDRNSASELESRLGCPIQWVFNYGARLRPGPIANLPDGFLLKGNFCHFLLTRVFGNDDEVPEEDEAVGRIETAFDERVGLEAGPLARPARAGERKRLRAELAAATRTLIRLLRDGGWQIAAMETPFEGGADGYRLSGYIDCLIRDSKGAEAIIDFKYAGSRRYQDLLAEGRAVQLAVYARGRAAVVDTDLAELPVAYLVIANNRLLTPSATPMAGTRNDQHVPEAPGMAEVWQRFTQALARSQAWMERAEPVPARPLQDSEEWPDGVEMVLDAKGADEQRICRYCDFRVLCGLEEIE